MGKSAALLAINVASFVPPLKPARCAPIGTTGEIIVSQPIALGRQDFISKVGGLFSQALYVPLPPGALPTVEMQETSKDVPCRFPPPRGGDDLGSGT